MFEMNLHLLYLYLTFGYFHYGASVSYNPYDNKQRHLLQTTNSGNDYSAYQQNLPGNSNYQQMYAYYYTPPYQQQELQPQQSTQLWSGQPIVVEDSMQRQQYQQSSTNIPPTYYQQHSTSSNSRNSELLPFLHRNSKVLPPTAYNPQPTTRTSQFSYNNNNNNVVYHRDFRQQLDAIPESQRAQQDIVSWNNQQHQLQQQNQLLDYQQPQQEFYAANTNLRYNGISNGLTSLTRDNAVDYREHFRRYLENNPRRIKPIY